MSYGSLVTAHGRKVDIRGPGELYSAKFFIRL